MVTAVDENALQELYDANTTKLSMGGEMSLAFGPLGRTASGEAFVASDTNTSTAEREKGAERSLLSRGSLSGSLLKRLSRGGPHYSQEGVHLGAQVYPESFEVSPRSRGVIIALEGLS